LLIKQHLHLQQDLSCNPQTQSVIFVRDMFLPRFIMNLPSKHRKPRVSPN
jgi:hypothetical protein